MPKITYNQKPKPEKKIKKNELTCSMCGSIKKNTEFYTSYSPFHSATGRLPYCKICLQDMCLDEKGNIDIEKVKEMLKLIDRPFLYEILKTSAEEEGHTIGIYFKNIAMPQYKHLGWKDSEFEPKVERKNPELVIKEDIIPEFSSDFKLTSEIVKKWGKGYKTEEYELFEEKYNKLKNNYKLPTESHREFLMKACVCSVKADRAMAEGEFKEAKEWMAMFKDVTSAGKLQPSQMSKADLSGGMDTFGQLVRMVEESVDIIPILPKFKEKPKDKVDFNIWTWANYIRSMMDLPLCEYKDIYDFYEERKKDFEQSGNRLLDEEGDF